VKACACLPFAYEQTIFAPLDLVKHYFTRLLKKFWAIVWARLWQFKLAREPIAKRLFSRVLSRILGFLGIYLY
jgi:hypothetical protein